MKKLIYSFLIFAAASLMLTGCHTVGDKAIGLPMIYGAAAVLSLVLLAGYCMTRWQKNKWFLLLFSSVLVVNCGYTFLSISSGLSMALWANRLAYLGSVFLPLAMLMIILDVTGTSFKKWLPGALFALSAVVFLIAASPGILGIYYKEVSFAVVNGVSTLVKVYGPLHPLYLFYLLGYFVSMVTVIVRAAVKKQMDSIDHAVVLAIAVFVNIGIWLIEQLASIDFEMLSVSYIISELFLLGVHLVVRENQRVKDLVKQQEEELKAPPVIEEPAAASDISADMMECFAKGLSMLTPTERLIYDAYVSGASTKNIMADLHIKENTLKFHNKNLYGKLGVSSRKQLIAVYKAMQADMAQDDGNAAVSN